MSEEGLVREAVLSAQFPGSNDNTKGFFSGGIQNSNSFGTQAMALMKISSNLQSLETSFMKGKLAAFHVFLTFMSCKPD